MNSNFDVLIAGCGTGYGAIECAIGYGTNAKITAIDLSTASIAYAMRMAKKYNVTNIEFKHFDLLRLSNIGKKFDIIECTGVLHHMKNPEDGGIALANQLKEHGIIHVSLYSELARRSIVMLRDHYNLSPEMDIDEIRHFRNEIMNDFPDIIDNRLSLRSDFFDLSRCKDLLFHPLEHRFTVPKIKKLLIAAGLDFAGMELPELIRSQYWTRYPSPKHRKSYNHWDNFEQNHPDAFGSLYQIWATKSL